MSELLSSAFHKTSLLIVTPDNQDIDIVISSIPQVEPLMPDRSKGRKIKRDQGFTWPKAVEYTVKF